jgi:uncharacterized membrane protein
MGALAYLAVLGGATLAYVAIGYGVMRWQLPSIVSEIAEEKSWKTKSQQRASIMGWALFCWFGWWIVLLLLPFMALAYHVEKLVTKTQEQAEELKEAKK